MANPWTIVPEPVPTFAITTEAGDPLTTEAGSILVTAPDWASPQSGTPVVWTVPATGTVVWTPQS